MDLTLTNEPATKRLGVLGAGRLGKAIAKTWYTRTGERVLVWSRSGPHAASETRIAGATWVKDWTRTLEAQSVVIALPGKAFMDLAEGSAQARQFTGNIFSAAASLSQASLQRVFPRATVVCIAPFLIDDVNSIPLLALKPSARAKAVLESFGDVDVVEHEAIFAQVSLLGAPWPAVVMAALQAAARAGVQGLDDEAAIETGRRIFFRGMQSLLKNADHESGEIVTPGGITERGLKSLGDLTSFFESVFNKMRERADEFKV